MSRALSSSAPWEELFTQVEQPTPVFVNSLLPSDSPRLAGENVEHARALAEADSGVPPILVHRPTMRVIDGMHRLLAAGLRGDREIDTRFFNGDTESAFVLAVRANTTHGLPLDHDERMAAAARILAARPIWSDRAVALVAGLSPRTVRVIRQRATEDSSQLHSRVGRDGRVRPLSTAAGRRLAGALIAKDPGASLRKIAAAAGISPGTVRDVRKRLAQGEDPVPGGQQGRPCDPVAGGLPAASEQHGPSRAPVDPLATLAQLREDPSLKYSEMGKVLLRMLSANVVRASAWAKLLDAVPEHCAGLVTELAYACADGWREWAQRLEERANQQSFREPGGRAPVLLAERTPQGVGGQ